MAVANAMLTKTLPRPACLSLSRRGRTVVEPATVLLKILCLQGRTKRLIILFILKNLIFLSLLSLLSPGGSRRQPTRQDLLSLFGQILSHTIYK